MKNRILVNIKAVRLEDACNVVTVNADELIQVLEEKLEKGLVMFSYQQDGVVVEAFGTKNPQLVAILTHSEDFFRIADKIQERVDKDLNIIDETQEAMETLETMRVFAKTKFVYKGADSHQTINYYDINQQREIVFNKNLLINVHV